MTETTILQTNSYPGIFVVRLVNVIIGIIEALFAVRIVLELFGASQASQFVVWIYGITSGMIGQVKQERFYQHFAWKRRFGVLEHRGASRHDCFMPIVGWLVLLLLSYIFGTTTRIASRKRLTLVSGRLITKTESSTSLA